MRVLVFEPLIPIALWLSLAVAAAALLAWYAVDCARRLSWIRAAAIAVLMGLALTLPLAILLNPTWHDRVEPPAGKPLLSVLVDASASMATCDSPDSRARDVGVSSSGSRFAEACRIAEELAAGLGDRYEVQVHDFAAASTVVQPSHLAELQPEGQFTDLAAAIAGVLQADRPQGQAIVLLSDGIHNIGGEAAVMEVAEQARALTAAPIFTRTLGGDTHVRDLAVEVQTPQDLAFVNQKVPIRVQLDCEGITGAVARVVLSADDKELAQQEVILAGDQSTNLEFPVSHEHSGIFRYEVSVASVEGEVTAANNNCTYVLRVIDEPIRVLLLEGKPYWDTKFLLRSLASDPSVEVVSIVRLAQGRYLQRTLDRPATNAAPPAAPPPDTAPTDTAPTDTAPTDTAPTDTAPTDTAPTDTAPTDTAPTDTAPTDTAPTDTAPTDTAPTDTAPTDTAPTDTAPTDTAPPVPPPSASAPPAEDSANAAEPTRASAGQVARDQTWRILPSADQLLSNADWLNSYQIVALGRDAESYLTDDVLAQLKRWLASSGGALVCFRGTPTVQVGQRLGSLLPVRTSAARETRFHVKLTEAGKALGWIPMSPTADEPDRLSRLPSLATRSDATDTRPLAVVFAVAESTSGPPQPVVTSMPYGAGRVVVLEGAGMWRWAFLPPQFDKQEQLYSGLWQSLTRWLVSNTGLLPTQKWALRSDKVRFSTTEPVTASLLLRRDAASSGPPTVELTGESLEGPQSFVPTASGEELGAYRVVFGRLPAGHYQAALVVGATDDSAARTIFEVRPNVDELLHVVANPSLMAQLSKKSGGSVLQSGSTNEVTTKIEEHLARIGPEQFRLTTAWDRWWVLLAVFAVWGVAWGLRRNQGLV